MGLSDGFNNRRQKRYFIRINDQFFRFDRINFIDPIEMFETDSMACIDIYFKNNTSRRIVLDTDEWLPKDECEAILKPKMEAIINFIEDAIAGNIDEYFIEV